MLNCRLTGLLCKYILKLAKIVSIFALVVVKKNFVGTFVYVCRRCLNALRHREERWTVVTMELGLLSTRVTVLIIPLR